MKKSSAAKASYHHGDLRRALIEAAVKLIEEKGPNGITLREVAAEAGVTKTAPYRHFSNKQAMIDAVVEEGFAELEAQLLAVVDDSTDPLACIKQQVISYARYAVQRPGHYQVMFLSEPSTGALDASLPSAFQGLVDMMVGTIGQAQRAGLIKNEPALEIALSLWSLVHGLSTAFTSKRLQHLNDAALDSIVAKLTDHLLYGIASAEGA